MGNIWMVLFGWVDQSAPLAAVVVAIDRGI